MTKGSVAPYRFDTYLIDTGLVAAHTTNGSIAPYQSDVCLIATGHKAHVGLVG
jgi:hypothetical protein